MAYAAKAAGETSALRKLGACVLMIGSGWLVLAFYAIHTSLPHNALEVTRGGENFWRAVLPEGWAFFSRSARQNDPVAYRRAVDGTWSLVQQLPRAHLQYALGLDRRPRTLGVEIALLMGKAQQAARAECRTPPELCLESTPVAAEVENPSPRPQLCGEVGIALTQPVPWAWSQSNRDQPIHMPAKLLRLEVTCSQH